VCRVVTHPILDLVPKVKEEEEESEEEEEEPRRREERMKKRNRKFPLPRLSYRAFGDHIMQV